ncbi:MAG: virulence factor SrfB [Victivallales bacterium]|nr:virulence factor SrfB [Victivallales bacterium]
MENTEHNQSIPLTLKFFPDSGTRYFFRALALDFSAPDVKEKCLQITKRDPNNAELKTDIRRAMAMDRRMGSIAKRIQELCQQNHGTEWKELKAPALKNKGRFIRYRIGSRTIEDVDGLSLELFGVWFAVETNRGDNSRGIIMNIKEDTNQNNCSISQEDQERGLRLRANPEPNVYMQLQKDEKLENISCSIEIPLGDDSQEDYVPIDFSLSIYVQEENGETIPVDLILDLGNSRTVALLLRHGTNGTFQVDQFSDNCSPINLKPSIWKQRLRNHRANDDSIINSTIVLQTPLFETGQTNQLGDARAADLLLEEWQYQPVKKSIMEKGLSILSSLRSQESGAANPTEKTKDGFLGTIDKLGKAVKKENEEKWQVSKVIQRFPQMFVRLSPVLLGDEALDAMQSADQFQQAEARFIQSSPKRYYWDLDCNAVQTRWNMLPPPWKKQEITTSVPFLRCQLLRYMPVNGNILEDLDHNPANSLSAQSASETPRHPRASSLTWMLLAILERAWEQANLTSTNFRYKQLKNIVITYPSGWLPCEVNMYRRRCEEAVNIFKKTNFPADQQDIRLVMEIDEAIASQMPYVFTEITQFGSAQGWVSLMGKSHGGKPPSVRIMNLDIGGGTTDYSIIEYRNEKLDSGTKLSINLLFKDGFAVAGDHLLRLIIDKIILATLKKHGGAELAGKIDQVFKDGKMDPKYCMERSLHVQRILIPMAIHFLKLHNCSSSTFSFSPEDAGVTAEDWTTFLTILLDLKNVDIPVNTILHFHDQDVKDFVNELFQANLAVCAKYAAMYDVDVLVLSGKPSEIPEIAALVKDIFPLPLDRIVPSKDYRTGRWYPRFDESDDLNSISDAKTVTAVGAALHFALANNLISNWQIENRTTSLDDKSQRNTWCTIGDTSNDVSPNPRSLRRILRPNEDEGRCHIQANTVFYRITKAGSHPEPVFMFRAKPEQNFAPQQEYNVIIERGTDEFGGETLRVQHVYLYGQDEGSANDLKDKFEMILHPASKSGYGMNWQDSGIVIV